MDPIGTVSGFLGGIADALRNTPGGFGILIIPLGLLGIIALLVSRNR